MCSFDVSHQQDISTMISNNNSELSLKRFVAKWSVAESSRHRVHGILRCIINARRNVITKNLD